MTGSGPPPPPSRPRPPRDGRGADRSGGPLVALCTGWCCARSLEIGAGAVEQLRGVIRESPGGVLVTTGCLHRCDRGQAPEATPGEAAVGQAVAMVGWQVGPQVGRQLAGLDPLVFSGVQDEPTAAALAGWIRVHARTPGREPLETLPLALRAHLIG